MVVKKHAFTMIELIFSIVVIAIAVMSLPVMTQTTDDNIEANVAQEAIFAAEAILAETAAFYWDTNSKADITAGNVYSRVVNTDINCSNVPPRRRNGHVNRRCTDASLGVSSNNADTETIDYLSTLYTGKILDNHDSSTAAATYKQDYTAQATVTYCGNPGCIQFGDPAFEDDIKQIDITIRDENNNSVTTLRTYSTNIGEIAIRSGVI